MERRDTQSEALVRELEQDSLEPASAAQGCGEEGSPEEGCPEADRLEAELARLYAHVSAAMSRCLELLLAFRRAGGAPWDDLACWVAYRLGVSQGEARELVRVAEALEELPAIRASFARGELTLTKVRALTRVATPACEEHLLELAAALTAPQLERALRAYRRVSSEQARTAQELEFVSWFFAEDGSLSLRARLPAEEGTIVVRALEACRERVLTRRREEAQARPEVQVEAASPPSAFEPERPAEVEALVELGRHALGQEPEREPVRERPCVVVHVDAAALVADGRGRCELEDGPVISPETARRLACDAESVTRLERDGLPVSVGRSRRTVPPRLRRLLEARDHGRCRFPGCERRRHLDAHHRVHWAKGGETRLDNLVLLCHQHHRLVHEGGYEIEHGADGQLRFRNRHGLLCPSVPPRSPPAHPGALVASQAGLEITDRTNRNGCGDPLDLAATVDALMTVIGTAAA